MQNFWSIIDDEPSRSGEQPIIIGSASGLVAIIVTWAMRDLLHINLPYLFCIGAVLAAASLTGFRGAALTTAISLLGTDRLASVDRSIVNERSLLVVSCFCLSLAVLGEILRRIRIRERSSAARASSRGRALQLMFDESPAATLITNEDERIVAANQSAMNLLQTSNHYIAGRNVRSVLPADSDEITTVILPDDGIAHLQITRTPARMSGKSFDIVHIRDLTDSVIAAEELAVTQSELHQIARAAALGQFGSAIAHELNQPLTFIANYVEAAKAMIEADPPRLQHAAETLDDALSHVFRASSVLKHLRDFVTRRPLDMTWQPFRQVLDDAIRIGSMAIRGEGIRLITSFPDEEYDVLVDHVQIQQVMVNLLVNASQALRDRPEPVIEIATRIQGAEVVITVTDNGPGIPESLRQCVFNPFRTTKKDGIGIGLAISRTIVEAHGGRIRCDPAPALGGASISFTLSIRPKRTIHHEE